MHGQAVELRGPSAQTPDGTYAYYPTLQALADRGFVVMSEVRSSTTTIRLYAETVAAEVTKLLAAGVAPEQITVTGFSKGGAITILTTAIIGNPRVNFVVMAGCRLGGRGDVARVLANIARPVQGRVLSIYDEGDSQAGSCADYFADAPGLTFKETVLHGGLGHGLFFAPNKVWLDPVADWGHPR